MVNNTGDLALFTKHESLVKDTINDILGQETVEQIHSLVGCDRICEEYQKQIRSAFTPCALASPAPIQSSNRPNELN